MPTPKAPARQFIAWQCKTPYKVRVKSLLQKRRKRHAAPTKKAIKDYRLRLRHAVGFYMGRKTMNQAQHLTITEQSIKLQKISTASIKLAEALRQRRDPKVWADRLSAELSINDLNAPLQTMVSKHLRENGLLSLKAFLDMVWGCKRIVQSDGALQTHDGRAFSRDELISYLDHLAKIRADSSDNFPRWSNPDLYHLVEQLAPVWVEATGRTLKRTEAADGSKAYHFPEWVLEILRAAGCQGRVTVGQINEVSSRLKIKK